MTTTIPAIPTLSDERPRPRPRPRPVTDSPAVSPPVEATARRRWGWRGWTVAAVSLAVIAALLVTDLLLTRSRSDDDAVETARTAALAAAKTRVPALLSYTYKTIGTYEKQAPTNATGEFRTQFSKLITALVVPAAKQQQIVTKTQVRAVGVVSAARNRVVTLVLLNQSTYGKDSKTTQISGSRVRVTMTHTSEGWLISELTPV